MSFFILGAHSLTCRADEVSPHLRELVEHKEHPEEPGDDHVGGHSGDLCVRLGDDGQVGALGAPERPSAEAYGQPGRDHGEEAGVKLGDDEGHVGDEGEGDCPFAAEPSVNAKKTIKIGDVRGWINCKLEFLN